MLGVLGSVANADEANDMAPGVEGGRPGVDGGVVLLLDLCAVREAKEGLPWVETEGLPLLIRVVIEGLPCGPPRVTMDGRPWLLLSVVMEGRLCPRVMIEGRSALR